MSAAAEAAALGPAIRWLRFAKSEGRQDKYREPHGRCVIRPTAT